MRVTMIQKDKLKSIVLEKYNLAKESISEIKKFAEYAVSDRIPGYRADSMPFGTYQQDTFAVLFADMRNSTERAIQIGGANTFLTLHAIMPTLIYIVETYGGYVIDLPGDGIMALFKENRKNIHWSDGDVSLNLESLIFECGMEILIHLNGTVNEILAQDKIPQVVFGVGLDIGSVIVTKTGTNNTFDTKALGDCINQAAKKSDGNSEIKLSRNIYNNLQSISKAKLHGCPLQLDWFIKKV